MERAEPMMTPLPVGTRLLHIGPSKTGTTSLQGSLWAGRHEMLAQGVRYASYSRHAAGAGRAAVGLPSAMGEDRPASAQLWKGIVREMHRSREDRVVFSSEHLAHASGETVRQIVGDLDPGRVHIAVTLRPLARILPSLWQQQVQVGATRSLEAWLERHVGRSGPLPESTFWHRHRHDRLVGRWADVVGPDHLTVVVLDARDPGFLLRAFNALLGLSDGTLRPQDDFANRSLTLGEIESIRAFNALVETDGLDRRACVRLMQSAAGGMKVRVPDPSEPRIEAPRWALDRLGEIAAEVVPGIAASGVRIIGDLDSLLEVPAERSGSAQFESVGVPPAAVAALAEGLAYSSGVTSRSAASWSADSRPRLLAEIRELDHLGYPDIARATVRRTRRDAARWARARLGFRS